MVMFCGRTARFVLGPGGKSWRQVLSRLGSFISHVFSSSSMTNRHDSSVGSEAAWNASDQELDPHAEIILSLRFGHKLIYMDILPLPRIHEEQLSAAGER